jgi:hydrophobic/amphiphilic exporter-1 (mainly G- bacteria), HAE1 family
LIYPTIDNTTRTFPVEITVSNGGQKVRPGIMTSLTAILGMIPMAIGGGQGSEMWKPMGIAVIGGLTISTVLTLVVVPVLYCILPVQV